MEMERERENENVFMKVFESEIEGGMGYNKVAIGSYKAVVKFKKILFMESQYY